MDITILTITELKALAYDTLAKIQQFQNDLQVINNQIAEKSKIVEPEVLPIEEIPE